jgi:hypothetical protein
MKFRELEVGKWYLREVETKDDAHPYYELFKVDEILTWHSYPNTTYKTTLTNGEESYCWLTEQVVFCYGEDRPRDMFAKVDPKSILSSDYWFKKAHDGYSIEEANCIGDIHYIDSLIRDYKGIVEALELTRKEAELKWIETQSALLKRWTYDEIAKAESVNYFERRIYEVYRVDVTPMANDDWEINEGLFALVTQYKSLMIMLLKALDERAPLYSYGIEAITIMKKEQVIAVDMRQDLSLISGKKLLEENLVNCFNRVMIMRDALGCPPLEVKLHARHDLSS